MGNKVLIVDDDPVAVHLIASALQADGYSVTACADSSSAMTAFEQEVINVALVELILPKMPGKELIQQGSQLQQECMFIVVSNRFDVHDFILLQSMGVFDSFHKPAEPQIIVNAVIRANSSMRRHKISGMAEYASSWNR